MAEPLRLMGDLLAPEQSLLWAFRTVSECETNSKGAKKEQVADRLEASKALVGTILGDDNAKDAIIAFKKVVACLPRPMPPITSDAVTPLEEELLALGWAAQIQLDTANWRAIAPTLFKPHNSDFVRNLTFLAFLFSERGMTLPQPASVHLTPGARVVVRPGIAGTEPRFRALIQCLRVMVHADRRGDCPLETAAAFLSRIGRPYGIAEGIDELLTLAHKKAPSEISVCAPFCPGTRKAEIDLIKAIATGSPPEGSWVAKLGKEAAPALRLIRDRIIVRA